MLARFFGFEAVLAVALSDLVCDSCFAAWMSAFRAINALENSQALPFSSRPFWSLSPWSASPERLHRPRRQLAAYATSHLCNLNLSDVSPFPLFSLLFSLLCRESAAPVHPPVPHASPSGRLECIARDRSIDFWLDICLVLPDAQARDHILRWVLLVSSTPWSR